MRDNSDFDLIFGGDTYFGEWHMRLRVRKLHNDILKERGYLDMGQNLVPMMQQAEMVCVNLECAITEIEKSPLADKPHTYAAVAEPTLEALKNANVHVACLANNHSVDFGKAGLIDTLESLESAGISPIGAGRKAVDAQMPYVFETHVGDVLRKFGLISVYNFGERSKKWGFYAEEKIPGTNVLDMELLKFQCAFLREKQILPIVIPHWGPNYCWRTETMQRMAHQMVKAGAGLIIGHSAHMLQEVEVIDGVPVFYSLGNFIMNGDGEYRERNLPPYSALLRLTIPSDQPQSLTLRLYPFVSDNLQTDFHPRFVTDFEARHVRALLDGHQWSYGEYGLPVTWASDAFGPYMRMDVMP